MAYHCFNQGKERDIHVRADFILVANLFTFPSNIGRDYLSGVHTRPLFNNSGQGAFIEACNGIAAIQLIDPDAQTNGAWINEITTAMKRAVPNNLRNPISPSDRFHFEENRVLFTREGQEPTIIDCGPSPLQQGKLSGHPTRAYWPSIESLDMVGITEDLGHSLISPELIKLVDKGMKILARSYGERTLPIHYSKVNESIESPVLFQIGDLPVHGVLMPMVPDLETEQSKAPLPEPA